MVLQFRNYGWLLMAIVGLGLATPQNVATEYARIDGGYDDYTRKPTRQFTLTGRFQSRGEYFDLRDQRSQLARLLDRDLVSQDQRLTLIRWMEDGCENNDVRSSYCRVWAKYQGGLEGNTNNHYASEAPITFTNYLPYVVSDGESGTTLSPQTSVTNVNRIALRNAAGTWQAVGTGASGGSVYAVVKGNDGKYYIGGDFTSFNGVANTARICSYDPNTGTVAALGTGVNNQLVIDLQVAPNGYIWAVGPFLNMGGVAAADYVAYWDGAAWNAPGTPPTVGGAGPLQPATGAFDNNGNFYLAPGPGVTGISKWTAATNTWSTIAATTGYALAAVRSPDGSSIMFAGTLSVVDGVSGGPVYKYTIATDTFTSAGSPGYSVTTLAYDAAARLYGAGTIYLSRYNGVQWINLVTVSGVSPLASKITYNPVSNLIYVAGAFSGVSGLTPPDSFFVWNGATALFPDIDLPGTIGTTLITLVRAFSDGSVIVGLDASGTATAASTTTVTNTGTGRAYPTITITGPTTGTATLDTLQNVTTGRSIFFSYTINAGETVTITFQPDNLSVVSSFAGNVASAILPGSNEADFFLQPGANTLVFLASAASVAATIRWRNSYVSLDDVP
jgi:hypothetical protein